MARLEDAKRFNFRCPYRDIPCTEFNCEVCEIEEEERRWMEESEGESEIITEADVILWKTIEAIKADILRYKSDCELSAFGSPRCENCNEVMFGSILRIIDKHTKGETDGHN